MEPGKVVVPCDRDSITLKMFGEGSKVSNEDAWVCLSCGSKVFSNSEMNFQSAAAPETLGVVLLATERDWKQNSF